MDEIGNMSVTMQVKLYRVLQEGQIRPVGSTEESAVDVRVIAATNKDLEKEIAEGRFREDLYYRLSVIPVHLPPLRDRRDDIPLLAREFLVRFAKSMNKKIDGIEPEAMRRLEVYDWPGNVRELENTMERAIALESGHRVSVEALPDRIQPLPGNDAHASHNGNGSHGPHVPSARRRHSTCEITSGDRTLLSIGRLSNGGRRPNPCRDLLKNVVPFLPPLRKEVWGLTGGRPHGGEAYERGAILDVEQPFLSFSPVKKCQVLCAAHGLQLDAQGSLRQAVPVSLCIKGI